MDDAEREALATEQNMAVLPLLQLVNRPTQRRKHGERSIGRHPRHDQLKTQSLAIAERLQ